ncbi:hypothetical protein SYNPS1DRAFT_24029 [Syncephalis pseudoplumigaleata]|uniref:Uncharacterized protein n=1 Tax=Syncephalis pseudoplumigaleata TaxID=1712513 RepID=A0A4P9YWM5_9FUNG|nr:hypothetical protein SYNPS1DRAFT_24029 [Syncephalis pseudoplumigaleata]|eukprot:RKP23892.1 hypothetical protein SYNPS1DRAFT_24029 [Syncephalis pseudoplumigaleata]
MANTQDAPSTMLILRWSAWSMLMLAVSIALAILHAWRYRLTRTRYHIMLAAHLVVATIGYTLQFVATYTTTPAAATPTTSTTTIYAVAQLLIALAHVVPFVLPAYLMTRWARSMTTFASTRNKWAYYLGIACSVLFGLATIVVVIAWLLLLLLLPTARQETAMNGRTTWFALVHDAGYGAMLGGTVILVLYTLALRLPFPRHTTPGMLIKRRQITLLLVLLLFLLAASALRLARLSAAYDAMMIVYMLATLFPYTVLTGFEMEPCLIVIQLDTSHVDAALPARIVPECMHDHQKRVGHRHF